MGGGGFGLIIIYVFIRKTRLLRINTLKNHTK